MSGFRELAEFRTFEQTAALSSGVRVFIVDSDGTDSLPLIGDVWQPWGTEEDGIFFFFAKRIRKTFLGSDSQRPRYEVFYDNERPDPGQSDIIVDPNNLPTQGNVGGSFSLFQPTQLFWLSDGTDVDIEIIKREANGEIHITKTVENFDAMWSKVVAKVSTLNQSEFRGLARGISLYTGATFRDLSGDRWEFVHTFAFRIVTYDNTADKDGWNYFFRPATLKYEAVSESAGSPAFKSLYKYTDHNELLEGN